jgi:hypothetical protein
MDTVKINNILGQLPETRSTYLGCYPCNRIPYPWKFPSSVIANVESAQAKGSHWVAIFMPTPYKAYYFDSLGSLPNPCIRHCLLIKFKKVLYNTLRIQALTSDKCGLYVIIYVYFLSIGMNFNQFLKMINLEPYSDIFVSHLIQKIIEKFYFWKNKNSFFCEIL